jgi:hypothetical protein
MPLSAANAVGDINITVSPMRESVVLNPGDTYKSSFTVSNPGYSEDELNYHIEKKPFYVDKDYNPVFEKTADGDHQMIDDWITITSGEEGVIPPNESVIVQYEIKVPENAPAGGQYACLSAVTTVAPSGTAGINIGEGLAINHIVLAEITGKTVMSGEITDVGIDSFKLGGAITAHSIVKNTGNVHGLAVYTMKVKPLFSDEVVYSSEGQEDHYVLPDREMYNETRWNETPMMGIFNVSYAVEFQGMKSEAESMVVICPWWLIFIIVFGIFILIFRIISLMKLSKATKAIKESTDKPSTPTQV